MSDNSFEIVVRKGPKPGQVFPLSAPSISIGRDPMSDITLTDPEVSRYHAQLVKTQTGYQIQDMGSTNGTYIDGERLGSEPVALVPGKSIGFGSGVVIDYQIAGSEAVGAATMLDASMQPPLGDLYDDMDLSDSSEASEIPPLPDLDEGRSAPRFTAGSQPPPPSGPPGLMSTSTNGNDNGNRRRNTIIATVIILLVCCCCAFLISGWFIWGDPLLELLQEMGIATP